MFFSLYDCVGLRNTPFKKFRALNPISGSMAKMFFLVKEEMAVEKRVRGKKP